MAEEPRPQAPTPSRPPGHGGGVPVRLIVVVLVALYLVLFAVFNSPAVNVSFVFFSTRVSLVVALMLAAVLGLLGGYLGNELRERRRRKAAGSRKQR